MNTLLVSEIFGPTVQGEGPSLGKQCVFLRLGGCNLHCVWCDTAYTWRFSEQWPHNDGVVYNKAEQLKKMTYQEVDDVLVRLFTPDYAGWKQAATPMLVVSGGEPLLQAESLTDFLKYSEDTSGDWPRVEIETAGTLLPGELSRWEHVWYNVSPKLQNSGNSPGERFRPAVLDFLSMTGRAIFKFVVKDLEDFDEIETLLDEVPIVRNQVYIMPEGASRENFLETQRLVSQHAIEHGFNLTTRLHILVWDKKRGV